ncbi:MAG: uroporphyrinogen-III C-methyltransferase [Porticoccaceae bacterium]
MNNDKPIVPDDGTSTDTNINQAAAEGSKPGQSLPPKAGTAAGDNSAKTTKTSATSPTAKKSSAGRWLLLVVLLAVVGGSVWWFKLPFPGRVVDTIPEVDWQSDVARLEQQLAVESEARKSLAAALDKSVMEQQLALNDHARRLRELSGSSRTDWLLAEAEYLMRLGNQRLLTERNSANALALLLSADDILNELDDVQLLPVREALAKNIVALKGLTRVDREGIFLRLKALAEQVEALPLLPPKMSRKAEVPQQISGMEEARPWYAPLLDAGRLLLLEAEKLIIIRHRADPVDPLLTPAQERLLRLQLGAVLEEAQLALMREEQQIYQASLSQAGDLLSWYFEVNDLKAQTLVEQLTELQDLQIVQEKPDISEGLNALRDYIDSWHNRHQVQQSGGEQQ